MPRYRRTRRRINRIQDLRNVAGHERDDGVALTENARVALGLSPLTIPSPTNTGNEEIAPVSSNNGEGIAPLETTTSNENEHNESNIANGSEGQAASNGEQEAQSSEPAGTNEVTCNTSSVVTCGSQLEDSQMQTQTSNLTLSPTQTLAVQPSSRTIRLLGSFANAQAETLRRLNSIVGLIPQSFSSNSVRQRGVTINVSDSSSNAVQNSDNVPTQTSTTTEETPRRFRRIGVRELRNLNITQQDIENAAEETRQQALNAEESRNITENSNSPTQETASPAAPLPTATATFRTLSDFFVTNLGLSFVGSTNLTNFNANVTTSFNTNVRNFNGNMMAGTSYPQETPIVPVPPPPSEEEHYEPTGDCLHCKNHMCTICLTEYCNRSPAILSGCGHVFCYHCIRRSLMYYNRCPNCDKVTSVKDVRRVFF